MEHLGIMSNTCSQENGLPPGFRFHPTDEELVTYYLTTKVLDNSFSGRAIAEVDLNKCEPWDLPALKDFVDYMLALFERSVAGIDKAKMGEKEWYFFSLRDRKYPTGLRTNRATEAGYWKATGKDREVFNSQTRALAGMKKTLVFYKGRAPKGEKTNWVMHEYRLEGNFSYQHLPRASKDEWVVCRIFHKNAGGGLKKCTSGLLMNRNLYMDDLGSPSLPPLLESPTYTTRTGQNEETELSDIASIMRCANANPHNSSYMNLGDPQFNINSLSQLSNLNLSQLPSMVANAGFPGAPSHVGLPSIAILRALVDQYAGCSDFGLKQCKMEPSASSSFGGQQGIHDINLRMSSEGQWMDKTQQLINLEDNNGVGSHIRPPADTNNIHQETEERHSMNAEIPPFDRPLNRSYQVDPDSSASPVDLDSLWAYSPHIMHNLSHHEGGEGM